ncbi:MAG: PEP-CTERM sorting domain-containing protein [Phycisphaerae bacterium]
MFTRTKGKEGQSTRGMTRVVLFVFILSSIVICPWNALGDEYIWIETVNIIPSQPTEADIITFDISGWGGGTPSWVEEEVYSLNGNFLQLDLYIDVGAYRALSKWTHLKQISPLPEGTYTLEVRQFDYVYKLLLDTYNIEFTVVPEPTSLFLFGGGILAIRTLSKKKVPYQGYIQDNR